MAIEADGAFGEAVKFGIRPWCRGSSRAPVGAEQEEKQRFFSCLVTILMKHASAMHPGWRAVSILKADE